MSDDSAVEAARRILAIDSDHIDSVDAIAVADAYLSSQSQVERMREALRDHCIERGTEHGQPCFWRHECDGFWLAIDDTEKHGPDCCAALTPKEE